jgi:hypothetical protein
MSWYYLSGLHADSVQFHLAAQLAGGFMYKTLCQSRIANCLFCIWPTASESDLDGINLVLVLKAALDHCLPHWGQPRLAAVHRGLALATSPRPRLGEAELVALVPA